MVNYQIILTALYATYFNVLLKFRWRDFKWTSVFSDRHSKHFQVWPGVVTGSCLLFKVLLHRHCILVKRAALLPFLSCSRLAAPDAFGKHSEVKRSLLSQKYNYIRAEPSFKKVTWRALMPSKSSFFNTFLNVCCL